VVSCADEAEEALHDEPDEDGEDDICNDEQAALNMPNAAASVAAAAALSSS
jgi:hypothetical protein